MRRPSAQKKYRTNIVFEREMIAPCGMNCGSCLGYMTYFALVPEDLKRRKLKIAIVLVHDKMKIEIWLSGINKQIQTKCWNRLKSKDLNIYQLPKTLKGADSIIEYVLADNPDFNDTEALTRQIESVTDFCTMTKPGATNLLFAATQWRHPQLLLGTFTGHLKKTIKMKVDNFILNQTVRRQL